MAKGKNGLNVTATRYCVYLLRCSDESLYCGIASDLERRVKQHNEGRGAKYTASRGPVFLEFATKALFRRAEATAIERRVKKLRKNEKRPFLERLDKEVPFTVEDCFDLVIRGAWVIDGTGNPFFLRDVGIKDGRVARIGQGLGGDRVIEAAGLILCPGFVDIHNHVDHGILAFPDAESHVMQGVTTSVVGNCGLSMAPVEPARKDLARRYLGPFLRKEVEYGWKWKTLADFFDKVEAGGLALNLAPLVGHGTIRIAVKGFDEGKPTPDEMERMKALLAESLEEGAFGLSSGLIYPPGSYAFPEELVELCGVLREHGGFYATHMRNEGGALLESVREALAVGEANGIPVQVSHHKAVGRANWGKVKESLALMESARKRGVEVNCDVYPYEAGMTTLTALLPPFGLEGGVERMLERLADPGERERLREGIEQGIPGWENCIESLGWGNIVIGECEAKREVEGLSLEEIAYREGKEPCCALFDLLIAARGNATMLLFGTCEADVGEVVRNPLSCIASDSWVIAPNGGGKPHPRAYGTFPRFLRVFVREKGELSWQEAIRKITSLPAAKAGIRGRGLVAEGFWADLVLFDPEAITDRATFAQPHQYPEGIRHVLVNGQLVVEDGKATGQRPGRVLSSRRTG